jgi:hypothetical protein
MRALRAVAVVVVLAAVAALWMYMWLLFLNPGMGMPDIPCCEPEG